MRPAKYKTPQIAALITCLIIYIFGIMSFALYNAEINQTDLYDAIDKRLLLAARSLKYMLAKDFHDRALAPDSIPVWEIDRNRKVVSAFAAETEFTYIYAVVKYKGNYYFSAPTVTEEELKEKRNWYFHPYKDIPPEFVRALESNQAVFVNYHDQWGSFRSVALPQTTPGGRRYLACADYDIGYIAGLKRSIYLKSALAGMFFLALTIPFLFLFRYVDNRHARQLLSMNRVLKEHRDNLEQLIETRTRDLMAAKEEAEQASRMKTVFLANVSHELRTPLNGILGYAERLAHTSSSNTDKGHAEIIVGQAEHMLSLINELMDDTKVVAGQVALEPHPFRLSSILSSVLEATKPQAKNKGLQFSLKMDPNTDCHLMGDEKRIKQVLLNLVGNAIKFTQKGMVSLQVEQVNRENDQITLRFTVEDTGVGIPPEKVKLIFDRFVQLENPTLGRQSGAGLGTTIAKNLVELMGGKINVTSSSLVGGSKFWFELSLPLCEPPRETSRDQKAQHERVASSGKILLVEDHDVNQVLITTQLEDIGQSVTLAPDGETAVKQSAEQKFDLILMDVQLPGIDGIEASRRIRRNEGPNRNTPIVALTASADMNTEQNCSEAGIQQVQTKPLRKAQLSRLVSFWLGHDIDAGDQSEDSVEVNTEMPMDWELSLREFSDDAEFLKDMAERFCQQTSTQMSRIKQALASGEIDKIAGFAHSIKGGAANLNAVRLARLASKVEKAGRDGRLEKVSEPLEAMFSELVRLENFLKTVEL